MGIGRPDNAERSKRTSVRPPGLDTWDRIVRVKAGLDDFAAPSTPNIATIVRPIVNDLVALHRKGDLTKSLITQQFKALESTLGGLEARFFVIALSVNIALEGGKLETLPDGIKSENVQ
jgi:hypothetical protein